MDTENSELIITGSFNGLLERVARISFFDVWFHLKTLMGAKKQKRKPSIQISELCVLTGLAVDDVQVFISLHLIECIGVDGEALLCVQSVLTLMKVLEQSVEAGVN